MINKRFLIVGVLTFFGALVLRADQIILNEGKVIRGKITAEDENEITLLLAHKMVMRIERSKVKAIYRDAPTEKVNVVRTQPGLKKGTTSQTDVPEVGVKNFSSAVQQKSVKKENAMLLQAVIIQTTTIQGKTFEEAQAAVLKLQKGDPKGELAPVKFMSSWEGKPSKEQGEARWGTVVLSATMTVTYPAWSPNEPGEGEAAKWNDYLATLEKHAKGHLDIYIESLGNLTSALSDVRGSTEANLKDKTRKIYDDLTLRAEKRQQGYDRRKMGVEKKKEAPKRAK